MSVAEEELKHAIEKFSNRLSPLSLDTRFLDKDSREDIFFQRNKLMVFDLEEEIERYKFFVRYYDPKKNEIIRAKDNPSESDLAVITRSVRIVHGLFESTQDLVKFFSRSLQRIVGTSPQEEEFYLFSLISRLCFLVDTLKFDSKQMLLDFQYVKKHLKSQEEFRYDGYSRNAKKFLKFEIGLTASSDMLFQTYINFRAFALEFAIPDVVYFIFMKYLSFFRGRRVLSIDDKLWDKLVEFIKSPARENFLPLCLKELKDDAEHYRHVSFEFVLLRSLKDIQLINTKSRSLLNLHVQDIELLFYAVEMMILLNSSKSKADKTPKFIFTHFISDSYLCTYPELSDCKKSLQELSYDREMKKIIPVKK